MSHMEVKVVEYYSTNWKKLWEVSSDQGKESYILGYEYKYNGRQKGWDRDEKTIIGSNKSTWIRYW